MLFLLSATIFKFYLKAQSQRFQTLGKTNLLMCCTCDVCTLAVMCGAALLSSLRAGQSCPVLGVSLCTQPTEVSSVVGGEATSCCGSPYCSLQNLLCSLRPQPQFPLRCCHRWDHSLLIPVWARSWSQPPCWNLLQVSTCTSDDQALSLVGMLSMTHH